MSETVANVRVAQVGCGNWGNHLARCFSELGVLAAVVDPDPETAADVSARLGAPIRPFEDVLADPDIAAVALASPAETHAKLAGQALGAGKHVHIEKPLALDVADAEALIAQADRAGRTLIVGHLMHYHPVFNALKDLVRSGALGSLRYIYSNRLNLGKFRVEENVLWSFAPHDISMTLALAGEEPTRVSAQGVVAVTPGIADWTTLQMSFPSGLKGHIQVSWLHPFKEQRLVVIGETAMAVFEDTQPDWDKKLYTYHYTIDNSAAAPVPHKAEPEYIVVDKGEPLKAECQHFLDCIAAGARPRTDGAEGLAVLKVLASAEAALNESIWS